MFFTQQIFINKPIKTVWKYFVNPDNLSQWNSGFVSIKLLKGTPCKVGAKYKRIHKDYDVHIELEETILVSIQHKQFSTILENNDLISHIHFHFSENNFITEINFKAQITFKCFLKILFEKFIIKILEKRIDKDLKKFKQIVETI